MNRCLALMFVAASATALAATPVPYSQLRQAEPIVNDAVAAMPNSDLNGTLNRLSELLHRSQVEGATPGTGADLPANVQRNMDATLLDLEADLSPEALAPLAGNLDQLGAILQLVRNYAFRRQVELYGDFGCTVTPCIPPPDAGPEWECPPQPPCLPDPDFYATLNRIADVNLEGVYAQLYAQVDPADLPAGAHLPTPDKLRGFNFAGAVDLTINALIIKGVESIDD